MKKARRTSARRKRRNAYECDTTIDSDRYLDHFTETKLLLIVKSILVWLKGEEVPLQYDGALPPMARHAPRKPNDVV